MDVKFRRRAYLDLEKLVSWIITEGYPDTAYKFSVKMLTFCSALNNDPEKFVLCRFKILKERNYRCAVFARKYVIVYKVLKNRVEIKRIFHTSRLK